MGGAKKLSGRERNTVQASPLKDACKLATRFRYKDTVTLFGPSDTQVTCRTLSCMLRHKLIKNDEWNKMHVSDSE
jgi:hypothetical protein